MSSRDPDRGETSVPLLESLPTGCVLGSRSDLPTGSSGPQPPQVASRVRTRPRRTPAGGPEARPLGRRKVRGPSLRGRGRGPRLLDGAEPTGRPQGSPGTRTQTSTRRAPPRLPTFTDRCAVVRPDRRVTRKNVFSGAGEDVEGPGVYRSGPESLRRQEEPLPVSETRDPGDQV